MKVSAVIPCYNAEPFLAEAIESALSQSRPPDEIVLLDDQSTDGSARVAASFGDRVRIVNGPHRGIGAARDAVLAAARGDLVAWLDADDAWEPDKLEHQIPKFDDPSVGLVYCRARRFGSPTVSQRPWPVDMPEGDVFERLYFRTFVPCPTAVVIRRQALLDAGGFDDSLRNAEDVDAWLRIALTWKFAAVPRTLCKYRSHPGQLSALRADVVRYGLRVREKYATEIERRLVISPTERRERLARSYLDEVSRMIGGRQLVQASALAALLYEAFAADSRQLRYAIAYKRFLAALPEPALTLRDLLRRSLRSIRR
jgi:glycosyltransferase involved in cell wall biosynthesis